MEGAIEPSQEEMFQLKFAPLDSIDYVCELRCQIDHLDPSLQQPKLLVQGTGQRPKVHIDIPASDYLSAGRRNSALPLPPFDPASIRVLEFNSLGAKVRNTMRFQVLNPTNMPYSFEWTCIDRIPATTSVSSSVAASSSSSSSSAAAAISASSTINPFRCITPKGLILSGKKFEMVFEYTPNEVKVSESVWKFDLPEQQLSIPFLLVGSVSEPDVYLDRACLNLGSLLLSTHTQDVVYLVNQEHLPFSFSIDPVTIPTSLALVDSSSSSSSSSSSVARRGAHAAPVDEDAARPLLDINPLSGVVPAESKFPLTLTFAPKEEKQYNANLGIIVKKKTNRLTLNVKGEGYALRESVALEQSQAPSDISSSSASASSSSSSASSNSAIGSGAVGKIELSSSRLNTVDFGTVHFHDRAVRRFVISNLGHHPFDFMWNVPKNHCITCAPDHGSVKKGESVVSEVTFCPITSSSAASTGGANAGGAAVVYSSLDKFRTVCAIGPGNGFGSKQYVINMNGQGRKPAVDFSFYKFDFGPCFLPPSGAIGAAASASSVHPLHVTNRESERTMTVDCLYEKTSHLHIQGLSTCVLSPGQGHDFPLVFIPQELISYADVVPFQINGNYVVNVNVTGQGTLLRLDLVDPTQTTVNLGNVRIGSSISRQIRLINNSKRAMSFTLVAPGAGAIASSAPSSSACSSSSSSRSGSSPSRSLASSRSASASASSSSSSSSAVTSALSIPDHFLTLRPLSVRDLRPHGSVTIDVLYHPEATR